MDRGESPRKRKRVEEESTEGASTSSFISLAPTAQGDDQYDVFLSFRGSDTRKKFTDHLYHRLVNEGTVPISVFRDDNSIPIDEESGSQILSAISQSKISIPIISKSYATSKWCLRELSHMIDCKNSMSHIVLPIFYKVKPSDVRYLKGSFGDVFRSSQKYLNEKDILEGQRALNEVSLLHGWESEKFTNGHEGELIERVVETIIRKLKEYFQLDVPQQLVGCDGPMKEIMNWIDSPSINARMIGIYGMGGIGKTTLAKCIYNQLLNKFGHVSFLPDVRETVRQRGITYLQSQLISDILQSKIQVSRLDDGINIIKSRFERKKVLILLDDIDHKNQLDALAGERNWFMPGSMIIVTTRNEAVLDQSKFEVDYKYELNKLEKAQALLLFNRHAFRNDYSPRDFESISRDIISTIGGLPLALQIVGSYLYKKMNRNIWEYMWEQLKNQPHIDVQKILQISYDALEDGHKEIFLDIACLSIGQRSKFAIYMWEDCWFYPSKVIEELKLRCLIKIGDNDELRMDDYMRNFGRSIVCQEEQPERRSRLWVYEEAFKVLMGRKGTSRIQAICLDKHYDHPLRPAGHPHTYTNEQFENLQNLRFLQLRGAGLSGDFDELFPKLRWLQWSDIEPNLSFSATNLHLPKLVVLELSYNQITEHWSGWNSIKAARRLKVLNLAFCNYLRCTPDLSTFIELEILILKHCDKLEKVDPSIGKVKSLLSLDLSDCGSLKELPQEVGELHNLEELILDSTGITKIPTSIGSLRKLLKLSANNCWSLREIPSSIGNLLNLQHLDISESPIEKLPNAIGRLKNLRKLNLESCRSLKGEIPSEIGDLSSLEILLISRAPITNLPESLQNLSSLQHLSLKDCDELRSLPELPSGLTHLTVSCQSPKVPHLSSLCHLEELGLYGCDLLEYIPELPSRPLKLCIASCHKLIMPQLNGFNLEELLIMYCNSIEGLHLSQLNSLKRLHVEYCYDLVEIRGHDNLEFLEEIVIDCCKSIERLILPELRSLKQLKANYCHNLVEIQGLDQAKFLEALDISDCGSIERLPDLSCFVTLKELNINDCRNLHGVESLERFWSCRSIYITGCKSLEILPNLLKFETLENFTVRYSLGVTEILGIEESRYLTHIDITGCQSIETLPDLSKCKKLQSLVVRDCKKLTRLQGLEKLGSIYLDISGCDSLEPIPKLPGATVFRHYEGRGYELFHEMTNIYEKIILR